MKTNDFCPQPRFEEGAWHWIAGAIVLAAAGFIGLPTPFIVKSLTAPGPDMELKTTGIYALVRHPMYHSEVLWFLGWALVWRSTIGLCMVPMWWAAFWCHIVVEEDSLERALGALNERLGLESDLGPVP